VLVELEHSPHGAGEERTVVAHDHDAARQLVEELLEASEAREVEVVGGLVEQPPRTELASKFGNSCLVVTPDRRSPT
jgi:selenophosphate synthetase-related protein